MNATVPFEADYETLRLITEEKQNWFFLFIWTQLQTP